MPTLSRWLIKASLVYLVIGVGIGGLLLAEKAPWFDNASWRLLPLHVDLLLWGWMLQLAFGVACWILPGRITAKDRAWLGWLSYSGLNSGLVLSFFVYFNLIGGAGWGKGWVGLAVIISRLGGLVGLILYVWPRIGFMLAEGGFQKEGG